MFQIIVNGKSMQTSAGEEYIFKTKEEAEYWVNLLYGQDDRVEIIRMENSNEEN